MKRNGIIVALAFVLATASAFTTRYLKADPQSGYFLNASQQCVSGITDQSDCTGGAEFCTISDVSPAFTSQDACQHNNTTNVYKRP